MLWISKMFLGLLLMFFVLGTWYSWRKWKDQRVPEFWQLVEYAACIATGMLLIGLVGIVVYELYHLAGFYEQYPEIVAGLF